MAAVKRQPDLFAPAPRVMPRAIAPDWQPRPETIAHIRTTLGYPAEIEVEKFVDWHLMKNRRRHDYDAAFRNWCRKAIEFARPGDLPPPTPEYLAAQQEARWAGALMVYFGHRGGRPGYWDERDGPRPGERGCRAPAEMVRKYARAVYRGD